jgi:ribosomal protein S18 acetylase RimI-like enzyme
MRLRIKFVDSSDASLVRKITIAAFIEYQATLVPPPGILFERVSNVASYIKHGGAIVAWQGEVAVGAARFLPEPGFLYIGRVAVLPAWRRQGIAWAMMAFLENHARERGLPETQVEVRQALPGNLAFYESLGYRAISVQPHPRMPLAMTVRMAKALPARDTR